MAFHEGAALRSPKPSAALSRQAAVPIFAAVLLIRVWMAAHFHGNFDSNSFRAAAELAGNGHNVYAGTKLYNYSPVWAYVLALLWRVTGRQFSSFVFSLGLIQIASDTASAFVLALIARRLGRSAGNGRYAALLFFANPVSVVASSAHGQFDGLAILALLGAIAAASKRPACRQALVATGLAISLLIKHVTLFQPLLFSRRVRRGGLSDVQLAIPYLVFAASFLPFLSASREIWLAVVVYGAQGAWPGGLSRAITVPARWSTGVHTAALVAASAWAIRNGRSEAVPRASLLLLLSTLVFLPGFALQYLVWPIALGSLYPSAGLGLYSLVASLFYCTSAVSLNWPLPVRFDELAVYAAAGLWLTLEAARRRRPRVGPGASRATFG